MSYRIKFVTRRIGVGAAHACGEQAVGYGMGSYIWSWAYAAPDSIEINLVDSDNGKS